MLLNELQKLSEEHARELEDLRSRLAVLEALAFSDRAPAGAAPADAGDG